MADPDVKKMWSKDTFGFTSKQGIQKDVQIVEAYSFVVDADETIEDIANFAGSDPVVPQIGDQYGNFPTIRVRDKKWDRISPVYWILTVTYSGAFGEEGATESATTQRPILRWTDTTTSVEIDEDADGNPIVNKNNEPIEGVTKDISDLVLTVERNYSYFDPAITHQYRDSVNSDEFAGFSPGIARLVGFSADQEWDETGTNGYWKVNATIQFRYPYNTTPEKAWYARVLHEGYYVRDAPSSTPRKAVDGDKIDVTRPVLLDADGVLEDDPASAHFLEFKLYTPLPYATLGLLDIP